MKVCVVAPEATVTLAGTVTLVLLLASVTAKPDVAAACVSVTVQVDVPGALTVAGLQLSELSCATGDTVTVVVLLTPLSVAVTVAVCELVTVAAVAVKVPVVAPETTVIDTATGSAVLSLDRLTVVVLVAALVSVTVQVVACAEFKLEGEQATEDNCTGAEAVSAKVFETPEALAVIAAV